MKNFLLSLLSLALLWGCTPKVYSPILLEEPTPEEIVLDEITINNDDIDEITDYSNPDDVLLPPYNPSAKRDMDLLHTKLDLRFDWTKEQVLGKATLTMKPYFYPSDKVVLDAKGFEFHKISFEGSSEPLKFEYDGQKVTIQLGKTFDRKQEFKLFIDYTATPAESGGSDAITSDKGLFFINANKSEPEKPQQIWTQGETENNSRWFPTIDKPNERTTQEITLTVEDRFKTLSNGVMASSKKNADGTRTDYWKMDMPHAPYLFMLAVGEYAVVNDTWRGKPLEYYVEPEYEKYAKNIFPYTPEMLTFFSDKLNFPYPWQKYAQVIVRDYVSGAMENTGAVIFGEFMQKTDQELLDDTQNEKIVAHEMFHHWFGDLVTCESWANLTLNEGFANYSEYLWLEHKHGRDEADFHRLQEQQGYMQSMAGGGHPLIHYGYGEREEMFDAHSYNKGGLVLHMLRKQVGDEAFFAALNLYLERNKFTEVEADELRLAFEDMTGEDLNWFFNQWFLAQGHPELKVDYDYNEATKMVEMTVEQTQDVKDNPAIFELPVSIDVYADGKMIRHNVRMNRRKQTFELPSATDPDNVIFDGDGILLCKKEEEKSTEEYIHQFENAPNLMHKIEALGHFEDPADPRLAPIFKKTLTDKFWLLRMFAASSVTVDESSEAAFIKMAESDPNSNVREAALLKLAETGDKKYAPVAAKAVEKDPATKVMSAGLNALVQLDKDAALASAKKMESSDNEGVILALAGAYATSGEVSHLPYFEQKFDKVTGFNQFSFLEHYAGLAAKAEPATMQNVAARFKVISTDDKKLFWLRYTATKSINDLHAALATRIEEESDAAKKADMMAQDSKIVALILEIKNWEKDERVTEMYVEFPSPEVKP